MSTVCCPHCGANKRRVCELESFSEDENGEHFDWKYPRVLAHVVDDWDYQANARLIAAAPELLEALQGLANALEATPGPRGVMELVPSQLENARAVIRKARGE